VERQSASFKEKVDNKTIVCYTDRNRFVENEGIIC
jgi:hypothetical protein